MTESRSQRTEAGSKGAEAGATTEPSSRPRLLIEEWLPAQAIGVECMRSRGSASALEPTTYLHVWWARRPLVASRAAVLASVLPAGFDHATFERLLGFGRPGDELVAIRGQMDRGIRVEGGFGAGRAFANSLREPDLEAAQVTMTQMWGEAPSVLDLMAGGGSIPLEAARLGLHSMANELNPVACSVLEATVDYPLRFGAELGTKARHWGHIWENRAAERLAPFYPKERLALVHAYIFARTVPCPHTPGNPPTPLVPDWHVLKTAGHSECAPGCLLAVPKANKHAGTWGIEAFRPGGTGAGQMRQPPPPTYRGGKGISIYTGEVIDGDYIKAMAQQRKMGSALYAVATKATSKLEFRPPEERDLEALAAAEAELARLRPVWERDGIIPTESVPVGDKTREPLNVGMDTWAGLFAPRQLLAMGVLVGELKSLRPEIIAAEGREVGEAVVHLLAFALDKLANWNAVLASWNAPFARFRSVFDRHDYAFKSTFAEMAACVSGAGLAWAIDNTLKAFRELAELPRANGARQASITQGSATNLPHLADKSISAVVVDPPYTDNVQYSELADFFYVWLKRTQGHRRPEWFSTYLCDHTEEAVVNVSRHRKANQKTGDAKAGAHAFYQGLMTDVFREAHRVLRDDGALTVMFTHKQQSAWAALFQSLIAAGFTITATWPIQTENQHSLHQAQKNAAQSTVILVARKRLPGAGRGYFDAQMREEINAAAQETAGRLAAQGMNAVDQMVGAFGPAMAVFSRYESVRTDTGQPVAVDEAIQTAADAVLDWRETRVAARGLEGVDPESRFVLHCWDVLGAAEFRFNEAMLLGRSAGMDVGTLLAAGLVEKQGDKVKMLPASRRRREQARQETAVQLALEGGPGKKKASSRQVHPGDTAFASAIDACHALSLRYIEAGGGQAGIGAARGLALQQGWDAGSPCARLMESLLKVAPLGVRFSGKKGRKTVAGEFPEFRFWHAMLNPLFGLAPPVWVEPVEVQPRLIADEVADEADEAEE